MALRQFRDSYVLNAPNGHSLVRDYYEIAPIIVDRINQSRFSEQEYRILWTDLVRPCVRLLQFGRKADALDRYKKVVIDLSSEFIGDSQISGLYLPPFSRHAS